MDSFHASADWLFYPVHDIGFAHTQNFSCAAATHPAVVHLDRQFSGFFRILVMFRVYRVIYAALLTLAALAPRPVIPCLDLVLDLSAFWASFPCRFCPLSHISHSNDKIFALDTPKNVSLFRKALLCCKLGGFHKRTLIGWRLCTVNHRYRSRLSRENFLVEGEGAASVRAGVFKTDRALFGCRLVHCGTVCETGWCAACNDR